ncbi:molybdopterin-synthase adenylyltransferase MoeB [Rhodohalobacter sp.]|uniref:molybdopterin-synthase adenylyltransferase MoeB n=1 Tax=Rhodohalobacter sp. TaxID=1974210 RepID=UPI002ACEA884|nr:molybdopterin-synthase adenylyltransferase MoeB [Rhodohalobacter sp.]MDZ7756830.1 molybdopterin-synthase adenylyltransferase MoeB [Rhodohalobacter sp.]
MNRLTNSEKIYYSRHLTLPEIGESGQQNLKKARVLVVGAGGLGVPVLQYLAAAGVGTIGIVDYDRVEIHNLHRQVLFGMADVGHLKAETAKEKLESQNPHIQIFAITEKLTSANALGIFKEYDLIVDCTDNFPARYLINDACLITGLPFIYGSIFKFEGQIALFNAVNQDGNRGPNYRDLYPDPPPPDLIPNCAEAGVLGVLPGIIGSLQANEAIKLITGIGESLNGKLLLFDALSLKTQLISIPTSTETKIPEKLIDYDQFCGYPSSLTEESFDPDIDEISYPDAISLSNDETPVQWIDVREENEHNSMNLGGTLIPLGQLSDRIDEIDKNGKVIVYCQTGQRSADAIRFLKKEHGYENLYNLKGGILAALQDKETDIS